MKDSINVVKIGGNVVDDPVALSQFVKDFSAMAGFKILVHGGGKEATRLSQKLGIPTNMIDGRRVTDAATLDVVSMVYAGLVNKRVVSLLQSVGCNAIGLSGADGNVIRATRRPSEPIDYGFVGDIGNEGVDADFLNDLCHSGCLPVICSIMHDGKGQLLNCNADSVATAVATALADVADVNLTFCFEKAGVLRDVDDPTSVIPEITPEIYKELKSEGIVSKGMIPKVENALSALTFGVKSVRICQSSEFLKYGGTYVRPE